jgi:thioredoxin-related protein
MRPSIQRAASSGLLLIALFLGFAPVADAKKAEIRGIGEYTIPSWFKTSFLDLKEDAAEAGSQGKRLLVYFGQEGCPYCAALFNDNFSQKHIVEYARAHFEAIDINMWGDRPVTDFSGDTLSEKDFAAKHKVWFTPTILFFDENGKQVVRINGYYPPRQFLAALEYVAERRETAEPFAAYMARAAPKSAGPGALKAQAFFERAPYDLRARQSRKPIAVFFEQKDCAGCDELHGKTFKQPATFEQVKRLRMIQLDRWSDTPVVTPDGDRLTAREWADRLNVAYVPTAVFFDQGKEVMRIEAMLKSFHVQSVMDYVASGAYKREPSFQRFIQARADHLREQGVLVDLWE